VPYSDISPYATFRVASKLNSVLKLQTLVTGNENLKGFKFFASFKRH
jgi:hypothetical protein